MARVMTNFLNLGPSSLSLEQIKLDSSDLIHRWVVETASKLKINCALGGMVRVVWPSKVNVGETKMLTLLFWL